jgi:recombination protein RecA
MSSASAIRLRVESALANKIPSALTPVAKMVRPVVSSGIEPLDAVLRGGFPVGALSEVTGRECSGRTSLAHSFVARVIENGKVAAWIDVSDTFDPASAAAAGIDLRRLLWVLRGKRYFGPGTDPRIHSSGRVLNSCDAKEGRSWRRLRYTSPA